MMGKPKVIVTGGSGVVGRHLIKSLLQQGYQVLNLDMVAIPRDETDEALNSVHTLSVDLTQSGQVFNALLSHFRLEQPFRDTVSPPEAIIHLAGIARNMLVSDDETVRINFISAFNVMQAACKLGVRKLIVASSVTVYGVTFAEGDVDFPSFPIDEDIDVNPMDAYAISKVCIERAARGLARRYGADIYVLRLGNVVLPEDYQPGGLCDKYKTHAERFKVHGWSYTDVRDFGGMCHACLVKAGLGFQLFNATNDEVTAAVTSTTDFLKRQCPSTPFTRAMELYEAPISNRKMKDMLGFSERYPWRN